MIFSNFSNLSNWVVITFLFQLIVNSYFGNTIGIVSKRNPTYLTPDGLTFIVWGFIYSLQLLLVIYQYQKPELFKNSLEVLIISFISNGIWCIFWYFNYWWVQFFDIFIYLFSLIVLYIMIVRRYELNRNTVFSHFAISANLSWCLFATVISLTVTLQNNNYIVPEKWPIFLLISITVISNIITVNNFDFIFGLVTAWALGGIYRNQNIENSSLPISLISENISMISLVGLIITGSISLLFFGLLVFLKFVDRNN